MKKILLYGGSFNPLHNGHDAIIRNCAAMQEFDGLWVMPSARRRDKPNLQSDNTRLSMLQRYWASLPPSLAQRVLISDFEIQLGEPSRTIRTHTALQQTFPDIQFYYIFGADALHNMMSWSGGARLRSLLQMVIVSRHGYSVPDDYNGAYIQIADNQPVSSTIVRQRIRSKQAIRHLVPDAIRQYIQSNALYT